MTALNSFRLFMLLLILYLTESNCSKEVHSYSGINVEIISGDVDANDDCQLVLTALEETLTSASTILFAALDGRYYFESFNILLPSHWDEKACITGGASNNTERRFSSSSSSSIGGKSDIVVLTNSNLSHEAPWTQQYGSCGMPGLKIFFPWERLKERYSGKKFIKEWAKYKYGVFDEIATRNENECYHDEHGPRITGCADHEFNVEQVEAVCSQKSLSAKDTFNPMSRTSLMFHPDSEEVSMFCDSGNHNRYAPTKHNLMCDRSSTLDVILKHKDFIADADATATPQTDVPSASIMNIRPNFYYRRRSLTRYVVIIDDSLDSAVRESWGFLRSAFRKWVMYDLMDNTEVGVILTSGRSTSKTLDILELGNGPNARDLVASFLPYTTTDVRQTICVECAVDKALQMLDKRATHGNAAHVILLIAPGMEQAEEVVNAVSAKIRHCINRPRVATINFPTILPTRQSLDTLTAADDDARLSYTINEVKYNSEKSYLTSFVQLSNVLMNIASECYEGHSPPPLEIHRREIVDSAEQQIHGDFYMNSELTLPAGFFIYTQTVETPLIKSMRLISPSGALYEARSDQRMQVKQHTLLSSLNESGIWHYEIERYPGNPQPHVVQVLATPKNQNFVRAKSWVLRKLDSFLLYTSLLQSAGGAIPVLNAQVQVTVTHRDWQNNMETHILTLYDNGADASEDISAGDGVYSRKLGITKAGIYSFEFVSNGFRNEQPFARYSPILTHYVHEEELSDPTPQLYMARLLNFQCTIDQKSVKLNCAWPLHTYDAAIISYEIRYAYSLAGIIDSFETSELLLEKKQVEAHQAEQQKQQYTIEHNIATTPQMYGKLIFIALRPSCRDMMTSTPPISNVVELKVSNPLIFTTTFSPMPDYSAVLPTAGDGDMQDTYPTATFNASSSNNKHEPAVVFSQLGLQLIAVCLALLFILIVLLLYYYIRNCHSKKCAHQKSSTTTATQQEALATTPPASSKVQELIGDSSENNTLTQVCAAESNYSVLEVKLQDHHTIGIPVLFAENDEEHLMQNQSHFASNQSDTHHEMHGSNHPYFVNQNQNSAPHNFYGGINLISNFDNRYTGEDSWSASQLLRDHHYYHQQPQLDSIGDNAAGPPVPPLPFPLLHLPYSSERSAEECGLSTKPYSIYHLPTHQISEQCIAASISYDNINDSSVVSGTSAAETADMQRRCRNITMV